MAQIRQEQHNLDDARRYINKAKEIDKFNPDVHQADALLLAEEGKLPEAIAAMKQVIDMVTKPNTDPRLRAGLLEELGNLYRRNGQYEQAVEAFKQMIAVDKDASARGAAEIIQTHREAKDYVKAQQEADVAIATFPEDAAIRSERAQLLPIRARRKPLLPNCASSLTARMMLA